MFVIPQILVFLSHLKYIIAKDLAENPCLPEPFGCLSDQVKDNIDRISCVVEKQKWSDVLLQLTAEATYPACEVGKVEDKWADYTDSLFIELEKLQYFIQNPKLSSVCI